MISFPSHPRVAAIILAGGRGLRMGGCDKPLLALNEEPLLAHLIRSLIPQCTALALSANGDPSRFAPWGIPVLPDTMHDCGPLAGVLAGLQWARTQNCDTLLTVPGDTPFIPPTLASTLLPAPAVAVSGGREHPLVATWPTACLEQLQDWLAQPPSPTGYACVLQKLLACEKSLLQTRHLIRSSTSIHLKTTPQHAA